MGRSKFTPENVEVLDTFVAECLQKTDKRKEFLKGSELYEVYLEFCEYVLAEPMSIKAVSMFVKKKFESKRYSDGIFYKCRVNPEVIEYEGGNHV